MPVVDGFEWSSKDLIAGIRFKTESNDNIIDIKGVDPIVDDSKEGKLSVSWPLTVPEGEVKIIFDENNISISIETKDKNEWFLELSCDDSKNLPFENISNKVIDYQFRGFDYSVELLSGNFSGKPHSNILIKPENGSIVLGLSNSGIK